MIIATANRTDQYGCRPAKKAGRPAKLVDHGESKLQRMNIGPVTACHRHQSELVDRAPFPLATLRVIVRWWKAKRAISRLSGYPDAMLKDIGLSRGRHPVGGPLRPL